MVEKGAVRTMRNVWMNYFSGIVTVKASGKGIERFINDLMRNGIIVWNVKKQGENALTFQIKLQDVKKLRPIVRRNECKIRFIYRTGFPFFAKRLGRNIGIPIGAMIFLVAIFLLSNIVWGIEIQGSNPEIQHQVKKELGEIGVKQGKFLFLMPNTDAIQQHLTNRIDAITWVGVELKGTTYKLQIVEKTEPEKIEKLEPRDLVASKKAVIVDLFVEEGQPLVSVHDHVKPGQILVAGTIGTEEDPKFVPAKGKILGETWYKTEVTLPLKSKLEVLSGNAITRHKIKIGNVLLPLWGWKKNMFAQFETEKNEQPLYFVKWKLPISYNREIFWEKEEMDIQYTEKEAIARAMELGRKNLKSSLPDDIRIIGEKILHEKIENGKVYLSVHFQVIENIAKPQPIIQGESE